MTPLRIAVLAGVLALAPSAQAAPKVHTVVIDDMTFGPAPSGVRAGDTIVWVNNDMFRHTVTAKDKSFDLDLAPHAKGQVVLKSAGAVSFYCRYHPGMTGKIVVGR
jgi:plastocyanin